MIMYLAKVLVTACAFFSLASAETWNVTVGEGLTFKPDNVTAGAGDTIQFTFNSTTLHSVTQSTLASPCSLRSPGIDSGNLPNGSQYSVAINDSSPLYFYCKVGTHCKAEMVFAVNVNASILTTFKANAAGRSVSSGSSTSTSSSVSSSPSGTGTSVGGYTNGSSGVAMSVQKLTVGLAGVVFVVSLFL